MRTSIDLNCDLGEGIGNEAALMPLISSCNLACGGHAGDLETIDQVVQLAKQHKVGVGAHPSFPDREHFGRKEMQLSFKELKDSVLEQIARVNKACLKHQVFLHHIKAHGALYNLCAQKKEYAEFLTEVLAEAYPEIPVYVPFDSEMARVATGKLKLLFEAFADRNYEPDGSLVSRQKDHAVITDEDALITHVLRMVQRNEIKTFDGGVLKVKIDTICVHGDTPKAVELLQFLNQKLDENQIKKTTVSCT